MSECHFWWNTGEVQWCDMVGGECHCSGWDDCCDMKLKGRPVTDPDVEQFADMQATLSNHHKAARQRKLKGAA